MDWSKLADDKEVAEFVENAKRRGISVVLVNNRDEALNQIKQMIPKGAAVANGSSTTLDEIGFVNYLKNGDHGWRNLHAEVLAEEDQAKQADMRRKMVTDADYFLASVNAISKDGELVACDQSGSRVTAFPFAAKKLVLVAGTQKISKDLEQAMERVRKYVLPKEDERAKKAYGFGSSLGKWVIIEKEISKERITLILVKEELGF